ncbi:hypothetical protein C7293_09625 [filamentous cyanobacterium CCT1]|nr:hypothetical protein C7293_09625 [filamentous cyanobacterium CCT1]PSN81275.1 hypothetical protein C8B47_02135 [filamentous cyanobacterium CCP4]
MVDRTFYASLKAIAKRLSVMLVSVMVLFGFSQTAALANSTMPELGASSSALIALAASSRFAAEAAFEGEEPKISESRLEEMREQRRQWQSEASANANTEIESEGSVGEAVKDKLNLEEITEENEIVDDLTRPYGK